MPASADWIVFDTSVYVISLRQGLGGLASTALIEAAGTTYLASVVWAELRAGVRDEQGRAAIARLADPVSALGRILTPGLDDWLRAGDGLAAIARSHPRLRDKTRLLWNDALVLLCAQQMGARVVTENVDDFVLLQSHLGGVVTPLRSL